MRFVLTLPLSKAGPMYAFLLELRRRSVFRVGGGYAVIAWLLIQLAIALEATLMLPSWFDTLVTVILLIGFPIALILAWAFEVTPEGFKRTDADPEIESRGFKLRIADGVIAAALVALVGLSTWSMVTTPPGSVEVRLADALPSAADNAPKRSIAVLPFAEMTEENEEHFSDGIAVEIMVALDRIPGLEVSGRTSAFAFKNREMTLQAIGEELGVENILEGSVRTSGDRVRVAARLTEAATGRKIWSQSYENAMTDIFDIQDAIARDVARELRIILRLGDDERLAETLTSDPLAYDLFLRGRKLTTDAWGLTTTPNAVVFLQQAVERDPDFVEAWEMLGFANLLVPTYSRVPSEEPYLAAAEEAADRAIALDPTRPYGHSLKGALRMAENRFPEAMRLTRLAATLGEGDADIAYAQGFRYSVVGLGEKALPFLEAALADNPNNPLWLMAEGVAALNTGRLDDARTAGQRAFDMGFGGAAFLLADIMMVEGRRKDAYDFLTGLYDEVAYMSPEFAVPELWDLAGRALYLQEPAAMEQARTLIVTALNDPDTPMSTSIMNALLSLGEAELFMQAYAAEPYANGSYVLSRLWDDRSAPTAIRKHPAFPGWADTMGLVRVWQEFGWPEKCRPDPGTDGSGGAFSCR